MLHILKINPTYLEVKKQGLKMFEIRDNSDRGFQKGDYVQYRPFANGVYLDLDTDEHFETIILFVTNFNQKENFVVYGETKSPEFVGRK